MKPSIARQLFALLAVVCLWGGMVDKASAQSGSTPCASTQAPATSSKALTYGGSSRTVNYVVPAQACGKAPAYVLLTYLGGTPSGMISLAQAQRLSQQYGAVVIAPSSQNGLWNDNPPISGVPNSPDDVGFLAAVIDDAIANYNVDPARVVMAGFSDGGLMTAYFACMHPEMLLGAVVVADTELATVALACSPSRPVSIVDVMGTDDDISPYFITALDASAAAFKAQWEKADGCNTAKETFSAMPLLTKDGTAAVLTQNTACAGNTKVELYTIVNGGHAWPGSAPDTTLELALGVTSQNLDATIQPWRDLLGY
jgi:polyhydroxybutyrate depolymerase